MGQDKSGIEGNTYRRTGRTYTFGGMPPERPRQVELKRVPLQVGSALFFAGIVTLPLLPAHDGVLCPLRAATGIPCPFCGMTTSVGAIGRGRLYEAAAANPAGLVALACALAVVILRPPLVRVPVGPLLVALGAMWVFQLFRFSVL